MRTNIDIDDQLMEQARALCGGATKKSTVEQALRLLIALRRQGDVDEAFGRYPWNGDLDESRRGRDLS